MADKCFENETIEDIVLCPNDEIQAGLSEVNINYIPVSDLEPMTIPTTKGKSLKEAGTYAEAILPKTGKGFAQIRAQVDTSELTSNLGGNTGNKKHKSEIETFLPGTRAELIGLSRKFKNVPLVFIVKDNNGRQFVVGSTIAPAYFDNIEIKTGKKADDENGATCKLMTNSIILEYTGTIVLKP